jgi:sugar diacid utilization regulator
MAVDLTANFATGAYRDAYIGPAARELAAEVDVECAAKAVTDDILAEVWPDADDTTFHDALHRSVLGNLQAIFDILAGRGALDTTPEGALEFAEVTARLDIPAVEIDKGYRVGLASLWSRWFDVAQTRADLDGSRIDELISGPTLTIHAYVDRVLDAVVARHEEIRSELHRTRRDLRRLTLTHILDGTIDEITAELGRTLDYCLADTHLALLLSTEDTHPPEREIAALRDAADARGTLLLQHGARSWIVWLGRPGGFEPVHLSRLRRALTETSFTVAVGEPDAALRGLRRTRQQALEAARVQRALGADGHRCLWAREVRLEALLLNDEERARAFLADELGRLGAQEPGAARLRETLLAWLATGSHVSAAAMLRVHENTVRNRIRAAEALLGTPLMGRRTELQVALRLERVLNAAGAVQAAGAD